MKSQSFEIQLELYHIQLLICINEPVDEIERILDDSGIEKTEYSMMLDDFEKSNYSARTRQFTCGKIMIRFCDLELNPRGHSIISHEIFHVVSLSLEWVGIQHNEYTEEAYAYLLGWMVKEFYEKLDLS